MFSIETGERNYSQYETANVSSEWNHDYLENICHQCVYITYLSNLNRANVLYFIHLAVTLVLFQITFILNCPFGAWVVWIKQMHKLFRLILLFLVIIM